MKKIIVIVMALLLCVSLLACNTPPEPSSTATTNGTDNNEVPKPDSFPVSGWKTCIPDNLDAYALVEGGVYYQLNYCLYFLDASTGYSVSLCSKPGCLHGEEPDTKVRRTCDAYAPVYRGIMFCYDGSLYYVKPGQYGDELYARLLDGTGLRKVGVLGEQYMSDNTSAVLGAWVFAYGDLYYTINVEERATDDQISTFSVLARLNLASGKEEELYRSEDEVIGLRGAHEDMVLFWTTHIPTEEDMQRPDFFEYLDQLPGYLRLWHKEGNGVSTLCETENSATNTNLGFANGKYHTFGGPDTKIYAYDFAAMTFGESDLPADVNRIWSEKYGGVKWEGYFDLETGTYYTNEYGTMQLPVGIDKFGAIPRAFGEHGFIVEESYMTASSVVYTNIVYWPFEKMNDGMQLSDRIVFMRTEQGKENQILQPENG